MTSTGSTVAASVVEGPLKNDDLDTLEADIDSMKAEVQSMRAAQGQQRPGAPEPTTADQKSQRTRTEATRIPAPVSHSGTKMSSSSEQSFQEEKTQYTASSIPTTRSYAQGGTSKLKGPAHRPTPSQSATSTSSPVSGGSQASHGGASPIASQGNTQHQYYDAAEYQPEAATDPDSPAMLGDPQEKASPRFAQPTQATTRRVGETLRKDISPVKSSPEVSPGKSKKGKAPEFETDKRAAQRQQKRQSLPEGWMSTPEHPGSTEKSMETEQKKSDDTASMPAEQSQSSTPPLRKKTSSYMSPTKAAQHRTVATIGQESPGRMSPRVKARGLQINTGIAGQDETPSPTSPLRSSTKASSDDIFFSPRSHLSSNTSSKRQSRSPKKASAPQDSSSPLTMNLPMPLREVKNTVVVRRDSDESLLEPIKEKLDQENLLKREPTQEQRSTGARRGSQRELLSPVYARLEKVKNSPELADRSIFKNKRPEGYISPRVRPHVHSQSSPVIPSAPMNRGSRDTSNEPISRLVTGLRGQTSAAIRKALFGDRDEASDWPGGNMGQEQQPLANVTAPENDPAILVFGRRLSNMGSQPSSLRATAGDFIPRYAPVFAPEPEPMVQFSEYQDEPWWQSEQAQSQPFGHVYETPVMSEAYGMVYPYDDFQNDPYAAWHGEGLQIGYVYPAAEQALQEVPELLPARSGRLEIMPADSSERTPSISPTSTDTSGKSGSDSSSRWITPGWITPGNSSRWTITGRGRRSYGWTGGDGLEIGFKGHGPDAEHNPNSPVYYRNLRTGTLHLEAASYPRDYKADSPVPPNAPRLMRQFAKQMGLAKIPCPDVQSTGKYGIELPTEVHVTGVCKSCKEGNNQLARIGGGIDIVQLD